MVVCQSAGTSVLIAQAGEPSIPEPLRTILLMALLGIALIGFLLVVGTMLGAHWVRRLGRFRRGPAVPSDVPPLRSTSKPSNVNSAIILPGEKSETVVSRGQASQQDTTRSDSTQRPSET